MPDARNVLTNQYLTQAGTDAGNTQPNRSAARQLDASGGGAAGLPSRSPQSGARAPPWVSLLPLPIAASSVGDLSHIEAERLASRRGGGAWEA
jgi:hypothetical protein